VFVIHHKTGTPQRLGEPPISVGRPREGETAQAAAQGHVGPPLLALLALTVVRRPTEGESCAPRPH